jgi:CheY-like chemotaxis protein
MRRLLHLLTLTPHIDGLQALTASCSEEERARCANAGMADLMPKPIQLAKLQASAVNVALCDALCVAIF